MTGLADDVQAGSRILIDDGSIEPQVKNKSGTRLYTVINGGEPGWLKGVNVPMPVRLPAITEKDKRRYQVWCGAEDWISS